MSERFKKQSILLLMKTPVHILTDIARIKSDSSAEPKKISPPLRQKYFFSPTCVSRLDNNQKFLSKK